MKKTTKIRLIMYGIAFVLPILAMLNCSFNWVGGGLMGVERCFIDGSFFRLFANLCYTGIVMSFYILGIPLLFYVIIITSVTETGIRQFFRLPEDKITILKREKKTRLRSLRIILFSISLILVISKPLLFFLLYFFLLFFRLIKKQQNEILVDLIFFFLFLGLFFYF